MMSERKVRTILFGLGAFFFRYAAVVVSEHEVLRLCSCSRYRRLVSEGLHIALRVALEASLALLVIVLRETLFAGLGVP